jgi:hypothetical protein
VGAAGMFALCRQPTRPIDSLMSVMTQGRHLLRTRRIFAPTSQAQLQAQAKVVLVLP